MDAQRLFKGLLTMSNYLQRIKVIISILFSGGDPVSFCDHLEAILNGLPNEFEALITLLRIIDL